MLWSTLWVNLERFDDNIALYLGPNVIISTFAIFVVFQLKMFPVEFQMNPFETIYNLAEYWKSTFVNVKGSLRWLFNISRNKRVSNLSKKKLLQIDFLYEWI